MHAPVGVRPNIRESREAPGKSAEAPGKSDLPASDTPKLSPTEAECPKPHVRCFSRRLGRARAYAKTHRSLHGRYV